MTMEKIKPLAVKLKKYLMNYFRDLKGKPSFITKPLKVIAIIIIARVVVRLIRRFIDTTIRHQSKLSTHASPERIKTLGDMSNNVIRVLIYFFASMIILEEFNIDTKAIVGAAGIGGLAIGFGAQSLVKDILSGFFILQEDSYAVGEHVKIKGYEGIVEDLGLRVTKIRDFSGDLHIIPNGEIQIISNLNRGNIRALVLISIAYEENIDRCLRVIEDVCEEIGRKNRHILEGPTVAGVEDLGGTGIDIRVTAMTKPMKHWEVQREIRKKVKERFDEENIEIPYPRLVMYEGGKN